MDNLQGCYCYWTELTRVLVHVFVDRAVRCTCNARELKASK